MKFDSYDDYVEATKKHYSGKDIKIPVEIMILSEKMFDLFKGNINFGVGCRENCENCTCENRKIP